MSLWFLQNDADLVCEVPTRLGPTGLLIVRPWRRTGSEDLTSDVATLKTLRKRFHEANDANGEVEKARAQLRLIYERHCILPADKARLNDKCSMLNE